MIPALELSYAYRSPLGTNLQALGLDDKTIQSILRHSNVGADDKRLREDCQ
jgi:hypothetical protein